MKKQSVHSHLSTYGDSGFISDDNETYSIVDMDKHMIETGEPFLDWRESYALGKMKLKIGDIVAIHKAGDVIPEVKSVVLERRCGKEFDFKRNGN